MDSHDLARRIRLDALEMTSRGHSSHVGSVLGLADILAVLYADVLNVRPTDPGWVLRDRMVLSKGHAGAGVYAALAESGFFDRSMLTQHCADGSRLSGHVSHKGIPGVEFSTGSLGHGLGVACGMALAGKRDGAPFRVYCVMSDGECDEGSVWEAALFAGHHELSNLAVVIDYNGLQSLGPTRETLDLEPFDLKWKAFGWDVWDVDGHDHAQLDEALTFDPCKGNRPRAVIARTVKGKGVSFMENSVLWHYRSPQGDELQAAALELAES